MEPVLIDRREGSKDLWPMLQDMGVPSRIEELEYGDASWVGEGPEGRPVPIGVEVKAPSDLLGSLASGRLQGHQIPGLVQMYEVVYLVVEGIPVEIGGKLAFIGPKMPRTHGDFKYERMMGELATFTNRLGLRVVYTYGREGTARWIASEYHWWTNKAWEKHRSHLHMYRVEPEIEPTDWYKVDGEAMARRIKVAAALADGVGWDKARAAAKHFRSVEEMICGSTEKDWEQIDGFGKTLARRVRAEVRRIG